MTVNVVLSVAEVMQGVVAGAMRRIRNRKLQTADRYGAPPSPWDADIEGAMAEMAVAKYLGEFWSYGKWSTPDTSGGRQVRSTRHKDGRLILYKGDADDDVFVLVRGGDGVYEIAGWIVAKDGKKEEYWTNPDTVRCAYFVPQSVLHPIERLHDHHLHPIPESHRFAQGG